MISELCAHCGKTLDDATNPMEPDSIPGEGDLSICLYCHHITIFESGGTRREVSRDEFADIVSSPEVRRYLSALRRVKAERN